MTLGNTSLLKVLCTSALLTLTSCGQSDPAPLEQPLKAMDSSINAMITVAPSPPVAQFQALPRPWQEAYVKATNTDAGDRFGSVSISGKTMVAGALAESSAATGINGNELDNSAPSAGAAYVYDRTLWSWQATNYLKASNTDSGDNFGNCVAISGNTIVVGAIGEDSNATGVNGNQLDNSAPDSGAAYVFVRRNGVWIQQAYLKASNAEAGDLFGQAVGISGDTIVVTAPREDSDADGVNGNQLDNSAQESGAAYVFTRTNGVWTQQAYLKAGSSDAFDFFGVHGNISVNSIIVGADLEDGGDAVVNGNELDNSAPESGAAYVFNFDGSVWTQEAYLKASNAENTDLFGFSVSIRGNFALVGALLEDSNTVGVNGDGNNNLAPDSGAAYLFERSGSAWAQVAYLKASNTEANDQFGAAVAMGKNRFMVSAGYEDSAAKGIGGGQASNGATDSGAAYQFYKNANGLWVQNAYIKASNTNANDLLGNGKNMAFGGGRFAVGSYFEDSSATGVGGNQQDNSAQTSGAIYIFR